MSYWIGRGNREITLPSGKTINADVNVYSTLDRMEFLDEQEAKAHSEVLNNHPDAKFRAAVGWYNPGFDPDTLSDTGFWEIKGQEGHNLGIFQGTLGDAWRFAIELPMFWYWTNYKNGSGGTVKPVKVFNREDLKNIQNDEFVGAPSQIWTKRNRG